jgi:PilZ domain
MTPVDQFLRSVRDSFANNRAGDWKQVGIVLTVAGAVSIVLRIWFGRWRSRRHLANRIATLATGAGLTRTDLDYLTRISDDSALPLLAVMTQLAAFERATAGTLASKVPPLRPEEGSPFHRVRRLRKALGFSPLAAHLWLLSTREMNVGDPVVLGGSSGQVVEVNEACFAVDLPATAMLTQGALVSLAVLRTDDSRYVTRVRLLAIEMLPGARPRAAQSDSAAGLRRVFFGHDEQPDRQQHREHVRVRVQGEVAVRILDDAEKLPRKTGSLPAETAETAQSASAVATIFGNLVDVSAGGLSVDLPRSPAGPIRRGTRLRCSFALGEGAIFEALAAEVVAEGAGPRLDLQHLRMSFVGIPREEQDRLAMAVARHQVSPTLDPGPVR